jgi:hypothetical protein
MLVLHHAQLLTLSILSNVIFTEIQWIEYPLWSDYSSRDLYTQWRHRYEENRTSQKHINGYQAYTGTRAHNTHYRRSFEFIVHVLMCI